MPVNETKNLQRVFGNDISNKIESQILKSNVYFRKNQSFFRENHYVCFIPIFIHLFPILYSEILKYYRFNIYLSLFYQLYVIVCYFYDLSFYFFLVRYKKHAKI